jgi:hypothetical protein
MKLITNSTIVTPIENEGAHFNSNKYSFMNTTTIKEHVKAAFPTLTLDKEVVNKFRNKKHDGCQKHRLVYNFKQLDNGDKLQLVITNSHDGTSSVIIQLGYYRMICSNGLMVGEDIIKTSVRHTGMLILPRIEEAIAATMRQADTLLQNIERMRNIQVTSRIVILNFTNLIMRSRRTQHETVGEWSAQQEAIQRAIETPRREGDAGTDLWTVLNRAQEVAIHGQSGVLRGIRSINTTSKVNEELFSLAISIAA